MTKMIRKALLVGGLALVGRLPGPAPAQAQDPAPARIRAVSLADLVGSWLGHPLGANGAPDSTVFWHLAVRVDSTYLWHATPNYTMLFGRPAPRIRSLHGDTLVLDEHHVYTVRRTDRRSGTDHPPELWLTAIADSGAGQVFRLEREWTSLAHTGRPIKCTHGRIGSFACKNVELLAYLPREAIGRASGFDMWGWHDSATGREFLLSAGDGIAAIEVTDPVHPHYLGLLAPHDSAQAHVVGRDEQPSVRVYQHYALVAYDEQTDTNGLQIFDLRQLRSVKAPTTFHEVAYYDGFTHTHTLTLDPATGLLTANSSNMCGGGPYLIDVRTPTRPVPLGCYNARIGLSNQQGAVHDAQCVLYHGPDPDYQGREICANYAYQGVVFADVTDRQHPKTISTVTYPDVSSTHQGWFTADQRYAFVDDETDEYFQWGRTKSLDSVRARTIGLDLADLDDPVVLVEYYNPDDHTGDHNLFIQGHYIYEGNGPGGLQILDIADPKAPKTAGYFAPKHNDASDKIYSDLSGFYHGPFAFGTYPYLKNGVVALSLNTGIALARLVKP